jgi:ArsR family transcriptional regulator
MSQKAPTDLHRAATSLDALGHQARLEIFRLLVKAGSEGLNVSEILQCLEIAPSTMAYHLKILVDANLVNQERYGRQMVNTANFNVMNQTISFLTSECCSAVNPGEKSFA